MEMILIRGLPGSGKSTLARRLMKFDWAHLEADMFFLDEHGNYNFDASQLGAAHLWCQQETDNSLHYGQSLIVSNTFTTPKELRPYFEIAVKHGIIPTVITCQNEYGSIHSVPEETMRKMKERWQHNIDGLLSIRLTMKV